MLGAITWCFTSIAILAPCYYGLYSATEPTTIVPPVVGVLVSELDVTDPAEGGAEGADGVLVCCRGITFSYTGLTKNLRIVVVYCLTESTSPPVFELTTRLILSPGTSGGTDVPDMVRMSVVTVVVMTDLGRIAPFNIIPIETTDVPDPLIILACQSIS